MNWLGNSYDRQGKLIRSYEEWSRLFYDRSYKIIKQEHVGDLFVSTVWLGLDHGFGEGPPLIFETMVFDEGRDDLLCHRYATEEQAFAGHAMVVNDLKRSMREIDALTTNEGERDV